MCVCVCVSVCVCACVSECYYCGTHPITFQCLGRVFLLLTETIRTFGLVEYIRCELFTLGHGAQEPHYYYICRLKGGGRAGGNCWRSVTISRRRRRRCRRRNTGRWPSQHNKTLVTRRMRKRRYKHVDFVMQRIAPNRTRLSQRLDSN